MDIYKYGFWARNIFLLYTLFAAISIIVVSLAWKWGVGKFVDFEFVLFLLISLICLSLAIDFLNKKYFYDLHISKFGIARHANEEGDSEYYLLESIVDVECFSKFGVDKNIDQDARKVGGLGGVKLHFDDGRKLIFLNQ